MQLIFACDYLKIVWLITPCIGAQSFLWGYIIYISYEIEKITKYARGLSAYV